LLAGATALAASVKLAPTVINDGKKAAAAIERIKGDDGGMVTAAPAPGLRQLSGLPTAREVAGPQDGFDDLSLRANPDSDMYLSGEVMAERRYLRHELEQRTGRSTLWPGDVLDVPVLPKDH